MDKKQININASKAVLLNDMDNIVIAINNMEAYQHLDDFDITIDSPILSGQKIARLNIAKDSPIFKYGTIIGFADTDLLKGQVLTNSNVVFKEFGRDHEFCSKYVPTRFVNSSSERTFSGFKRSDGRVGTRNFIAVVSTVNCSATVVHEIASYFTPEKLTNYPNVDGVAAFSHSTGCGMELSGEPMNLLNRTLGGYISHPNVASSLVVGLGCERCQVGGLFSHQGLSENENLKTLVMQENGGTTATIKEGIKIVEGMLEKANGIFREEVPLSNLMVGLQCGGSDAFSSISANPSLGKAVDILVSHGGTAILSETPEIYGVENTLTARAINSSVAEKLLDRVNWWKNVYAVGRDVQINGIVSPGNQKGGLANIL